MCQALFWVLGINDQQNTREAYVLEGETHHDKHLASVMHSSNDNSEGKTRQVKRVENSRGLVSV